MPADPRAQLRAQRGEEEIEIIAVEYTGEIRSRWVTDTRAAHRGIHRLDPDEPEFCVRNFGPESRPPIGH